MCIAAAGLTSGSSSRSISFWGAFDNVSREVRPLARRLQAWGSRCTVIDTAWRLASHTGSSKEL
jgi:hypothetical protein